MKIKTALNRIYWRFGGNDNKNRFPVNEKDVEAYNSIKNYIAEKEKAQFVEQELFAKLFIYLYQKVIEQDQGNIFDTHCRRKIYNLLKKPMPQIISDFQQSLNDSEMYNLMEEVGIDIDKHPAFKTEDQKNEETEKLKDKIANPDNHKRLSGEVWDFESVEECLISEVNQALDLYQRKPPIKNT